MEQETKKTPGVLGAIGQVVSAGASAVIESKVVTAFRKANDTFVDELGVKPKVSGFLRKMADKMEAPVETPKEELSAKERMKAAWKILKGG